MLCARKSSRPVSSLTVSWQPKLTDSFRTLWSSWRGTSPPGSSSSERPGKCFILYTKTGSKWYWLFGLVLKYSILSLPLQSFLLPLRHPADVVLRHCLRSGQSHAASTGHKPWDQPIRFSGQQGGPTSRQEEGKMCCHIWLLHFMESTHFTLYLKHFALCDYSGFDNSTC